MPTHAEKRVLPYSPDQLYGLVADIPRYPEFLPWCLAVRMRKREGNLIRRRPDHRLPRGARERFTSRVTLKPEERRIDVAYIEGPLQAI